MKIFTIILLSLLTLNCFSDIPDIVITVLSSHNGYATVGGKLSTKPKSPVGVVVSNGNVSYSTVTDLDGRWAVVIRHLSTNVSVQSFNLYSEERSKTSNYSFESASNLPWTNTVSARESSNSEFSAKYQTESSLRYKIDQKRSRCRNDKGFFSDSPSSTTCYKSGSTWTCSAYSTCYCRK